MNFCALVCWHTSQQVVISYGFLLYATTIRSIITDNLIIVYILVNYWHIAEAVSIVPKLRADSFVIVNNKTVHSLVVFVLYIDDLAVLWQYQISFNPYMLNKNLPDLLLNGLFFYFGLWCRGGVGCALVSYATRSKTGI